jgi:hypothetical protein
MTTFNKKAQELDAREILQGLEEFATFMSFQSNHEHMRILSVETTEPTALPYRTLPSLRSVSTHRSTALPI